MRAGLSLLAFGFVCSSLVASRVSEATDLWVGTTGRSSGPGTVERPFDTMQNALRRAQPGDRVLVRAGIYPGGGWISAHGTADAPITVVAANGYRRSILEGGREGLRIGDGGSYLVFEGFEVRNTTDNVMHIDGDSHHITLRGLYAHDAGNDGDVLKVNQAHHIVVERSELARPGRRVDSTDNPYQECIDFVASDEIAVRDSYIHDGGNNLMYAKGGSTGVVFERNVIAGQYEGAIDPMVGLGAATDRSLISHGGAFEVYDLVFRNNVVIGGRYGALAVYDGRNVNIANNLFLDNDGVLVEFRAGNGSAARTEGVRLVNNVFLDTRGRLALPLRRQSHAVDNLFHSHNTYWNGGSDIPTNMVTDLAMQEGYATVDPMIAAGARDSYLAVVRGLRPMDASPLANSGYDARGEPYEVTTDLNGLPRMTRRDRGPWDLGAPLPAPREDPPALFPDYVEPVDGGMGDGGTTVASDEGGCHATPRAPQRGGFLASLTLALLGLAVERRRRV